MACFGLKQGQDLEKRTAHPHREFRGIPPGVLRLFTDNPHNMFSRAQYGESLM